MCNKEGKTYQQHAMQTYHRAITELRIITIKKLTNLKPTIHSCGVTHHRNTKQSHAALDHALEVVNSLINKALLDIHFHNVKTSNLSLRARLLCDL